MLPYILLITFIVMFIYGIIEQRTGSGFDPGFGWLLGGGLGIVFTIAAWGLSYGCSLETNGELSVAHQNLQIMQQTVANINEVAMIEDTSQNQFIGGVENMQQSREASQALAAYRDAVVEYNRMIGVRKVYRNNFWLRYFVADVPQGIEIFPLILTTEE